jgi:activating signal cointegrator 1
MREEIRMLSLWQPWASLVATGIKQVETRHWPTNYRGLIAIHAAKRPVCRTGHELISAVGGSIPDGMVVSYGAIVAVARLRYCTQMAVNNEQQAYCYLPSGERFYPSVTEELCGNWDDGRYAWFLEDVKSVDPIYTRGMQGIPRIADPEILQLIEQRLGEVA